jgi:hypothetical protein
MNTGGSATRSSRLFKKRSRFLQALDEALIGLER